MAPQDPPVTAKSSHQPVPIETLSARLQHMGNISAVEPLPLHNISLLPDHLLRRYDSDVHIEYGRFVSVLEPDVIDHSQPVAGTKYDINVHSPALNFGQPMGEGILGRVTGFTPDSKRPRNICRPEKQIKIFSIPINPGVVAQRVSAANQKMDVILAEQLHYGAAHVASAFSFHCLECASQVVCASK